MAAARAGDPGDESASRCLYCHGTDLRIVHRDVPDRLGHVPGGRTWATCATCGSAAVVPPPRREELASFYPESYGFTTSVGGTNPIARAVSALEYRVFLRRWYMHNVRAIDRRAPGRRLLDIGCGRGLRMVEFRRLGYDVTGLDLDEPSVRYVVDELGLPAICAEVGEAETLLAGRRFDVITAFHLIEHVVDVDEFLASASRLLEPGGLLVLATPFADSLQARLLGRRFIGYTEAPRHVSMASRGGLEIALRRAGYDAVEIASDEIVSNAAVLGLSLVPAAAVTHAYRGGVRPLLRRGVGAAVSIVAIPYCLVESRVLRRPPQGSAYAHSATAR